jgi:hypothetical protein
MENTNVAQGPLIINVLATDRVRSCSSAYSRNRHQGMLCYFRARLVVLLGVVVTDGKDEVSRFYAALPRLTGSQFGS